MKKFLIIERDTEAHGFQVYSQHETIKEAKAKLSDGEEVASVEILSKSAQYTNDGDCEYSVATVTADVDNERHEVAFTVQLAGGEYLSQMGCWATTTGADFAFSDIERMIWEVAEVVSQAEKSASQYELGAYDYLDSEFNCAINSNNLYVRVNKQDGSATLVLKDSSHNSHDYSISYSTNEEFDSKEEAFEFLDQFRTGEHQDCRGLYAYLHQDRNN